MNTGIMTNAQLENIAKKAGEGHFRDVTAHFQAFRDFKVKWSRSYSWISLEVSDYLKGAPEEVVSSIFETIFARISGDRASYSQATSDYLSSDEFVIKNQTTYLTRGHDVGDCHGAEMNLDMVYHNLIKAGLVKEDPLVYIGWAPSKMARSSGSSSTLMKVVKMNGILDNRELPWTILDYALYRQLAFIGMGFDATGADRSEQYEALLDKYPFREEAEELAEQYNIIL